MTNKKTTTGPRDQNRGLEENKKFEKRMDLLVGELRALLTCPKDDDLFDRLLTRTMVILKKEPSLRNFWKQATRYHQRIIEEKNALLVDLNRLREELKLDDELPSLVGEVRVSSRMDEGRLLPKGCWKKSWKKVVPVEVSDKWIYEAGEWARSKTAKIKPFSKQGEKVLNLLECVSRWRNAEIGWYPIGRHPVFSLARLLSVCDRVKFFLENEPFYSLETNYGDISSMDPLEVVVKDIRREVELVVANLIAELPIIKSWGKFAVGAIDWKMVAGNIANETWMKDRTMSVANMASLIYPKVRKWGIRISTIEKHLASIDPRTPEERKLARMRKKSKRHES